MQYEGGIALQLAFESLLLVKSKYSRLQINFVLMKEGLFDDVYETLNIDNIWSDVTLSNISRRVYIVFIFSQEAHENLT